MGARIARTTHRCEIKAAWGDDWEAATDLVCDGYVHAAAPSYGQASFHYHFGSIIDSRVGTSFTTKTALTLANYFVRVFIQEDGAESETLGWVGQFVDQIDGLVRFDMLAGTASLFAFEMAFVFDQIIIKNGLAKHNGSQQSLPYCPTFNRNDQKGRRIIGNRSANPILTTPVDFYVFENIEEDVDPDAAYEQCWNAIQVFHHLFHYWTSIFFPIEWEFVWPADTLEKILDVWDIDGKSLWVAINEVINRRYGFCLSIKVDVDDKVHLRVDTVVKSDLVIGGVTIPANDHQVTLTIPSAPDQHLWGQLSLRLTHISMYGRIIVRGNRIKCMGTFRADGPNYQLDKWWSSTLQDAYDAAGGTTDPDLADKRRAREIYNGVYARLVVVSDWDGMCDALGTPIPLLIKSDKTTGVDTATVGDFWMGNKAFERQWFLRAGYDYTVFPPVKKAGASAYDDFQPMQAWILDGMTGPAHDATGRYIPIDRIAEVLPDLNVSMNMRSLDGQMGIHVDVTPNHMLAGEFFEAVTNVEPEFDWTTILVTAVVEHDQCIAKETVIDNGVPERTLVIEVDADLWYIAPGTVIDVDDEGELAVYDGPAFIRDGRRRIDQVLASAVAWYGEPRQAIKIPLKQVKRYCDLGDMITAITGAVLPFAVNAVVTSISINLKNQTMEIETGWGHLDYAPDFGRVVRRRIY